MRSGHFPFHFIVWLVAGALLLNAAIAQEPTPAQVVPAATPAPEPNPPAAALAKPTTSSQDSICLMIESAANANGLPVEFFARVI